MKKRTVIRYNVVAEDEHGDWHNYLLSHTPTEDTLRLLGMQRIVHVERVEYTYNYEPKALEPINYKQLL